MTGKRKEGLVLAPIIFKKIGGTLYAVYGYFSPAAKETATAKAKRLISKEIEQKKGKIL